MAKKLCSRFSEWLWNRAGPICSAHCVLCVLTLLEGEDSASAQNESTLRTNRRHQISRIHLKRLLYPLSSRKTRQKGAGEVVRDEGKRGVEWMSGSETRWGGRTNSLLGPSPVPSVLPTPSHSRGPPSKERKGSEASWVIKPG